MENTNHIRIDDATPPPIPADQNFPNPMPIPGVTPSPIADDYPIAGPLDADDSGIYDGADPADEATNDGFGTDVDVSFLSGDDMEPVETGQSWNRNERRVIEDVTILSGPDVLHGESIDPLE